MLTRNLHAFVKTVRIDQHESAEQFGRMVACHNHKWGGRSGNDQIGPAANL